MRIAITGGTGSLGSALITRLAETGIAERIVVVSRDEQKSSQLEDRWRSRLSQLRCSLGDVRDRARLTELFRGCDTVIHAAALKRVEHSVYSPREVMRTNVDGTMNVIDAAVEAGVARVVVVSSDKAVEPTNIYGVSKAAAETFAVQQNSYTVPRGTLVSCVRYGNVLGSRGSVVHVWRDQIARHEPLSITDREMTRFVITLPEAADFVLKAVKYMQGGEVFVPRLPAARTLTLASAVLIAEGQNVAGYPLVYTGLRPGGEKLHESLLSREEPSRTWIEVLHNRMVVLPSHHSWRLAFDTLDRVRVSESYASNKPDVWLDVDQLAGLVNLIPRA